MYFQDPPIVLTAMGHYHPDNRIPNSFFEQLDIGSDSSWIEQRTGIRSRRSVLAQQDLLDLRRGKVSILDLHAKKRVMTISEMAAKSWSVAQQRLHNGNRNVDLLICGTSIPDYCIPANACSISERLGFSCTSIDVNSACSSFVVDAHLARSLLRNGEVQTVAVFNPERYTTRLDFSDRSSCVLFGDGCSTAVFTRHRSADGFELLDSFIASRPSQFGLVTVPIAGLFSQQGGSVQKFAIRQTVEAVDMLLKRNNLSLADINYFIGHQANYRMLESIIRKLGMDPGKHLHNVRDFANQGATGAPAVLSMAWDRFQSGDLVIMAVVGSGLSWGAILLKKR